MPSKKELTKRASKRALKMLDQRLIKRGYWRGYTTDGQETLCALLALKGSTGGDNHYCPAWLRSSDNSRYWVIAQVL